MMDTILNLGLNDKTLEGLIKITSDGRFAYDAYRRFIQLFGKIALGVEEKEFDQILNQTKEKTGAKEDTDLDGDHLKDICKQYLGLVKKRTGTPFPEDPMVQLRLAIEAVFRSWMGKRAMDYRKEFNITQRWRTNRRQCLHHGVWKYGFRLGDRGCFYTGPGHRREYPLRRVSRECSG